ncbi:MAG: copper chaperone PCu(A)C [Chromatiaceae bacterium]
MRTSLALSLAALLLACSPLTLAAGNAVSVSDAWVAEGAPDAKALNAYMTLHNASDGNVAVIGASTPAAERVELHRAALKSQVLGIERSHKLIIPAGLDVRLQSKGLHFSLVNPKRQLNAGDTVDIVLQLDNGDRLDVSAEVRRR